MMSVPQRSSGAWMAHALVTKDIEINSIYSSHILYDIMYAHNGMYIHDIKFDQDPKVPWECSSCKDPERSSAAYQDRTWGHLGRLNCKDCMARCDDLENCDGIQCNKWEPSGHVRNSHSISDNTQAMIPVGISCQWLRKPRKAHACVPNDKYDTCWKKEDDDDGTLHIY